MIFTCVGAYYTLFFSVQLFFFPFSSSFLLLIMCAIQSHDLQQSSSSSFNNKVFFSWKLQMAKEIRMTNELVLKLIQQTNRKNRHLIPASSRLANNKLSSSPFLFLTRKSSSALVLLYFIFIIHHNQQTNTKMYTKRATKSCECTRHMHGVGVWRVAGRV